ncbi:MAG: sigma-70 family RNA polymerase sigma factor [Deltaproteobacteria bacterium]|jgi:NitT/TauT family transport system substrate-binding protein|nr:sigma-70 family RNA polymerase sigma factor [Deltaproteobacteria bacterium]
MTLKQEATCFPPTVSGDKNLSEAGGYQALVLAASAGDRKAFSELVKRFQGMASAVAGRWFDDKGLIEDALQEAFLKAFLELPNLRDVHAFPSWFRKILHNCCNRLKKRQRSLLPDSGEALKFLPDPAPDPYEQMVRSQSRAMVARTLNALGGVAREACIQRYILGRPYKEIAAALQVPEGTIKRRVHDARARMFKTFRAHDDPVIRVGYLPISDHLLGMVSHHINRGNLEIRLKKFLSWACLATALENGLLDAAFVMAPMAMAMRNKGVPIVYIMDAHHEGSAITVRNDLAANKRWSSNRVGMPYAISTHSILFADMVGMDRVPGLSSKNTRYRGPSYLLNSLVNREIDAFFCAEPWNTKAVIEGKGRILARSKDFLPGHMCCILVVREAFLEKHGDLVRQYLRLLLSSNEYLSKNYRRCAKIQEHYTGVSADIIEHILDKSEVTFNDIIPDRGRTESLMNLAVQAGILDGPCDLNAFLCSGIL